MEKVLQALLVIQAGLKAPKSQHNSFGGYNYRKAEDILEAIKPFLKENNCIVACTDDLVYVEGRHYVKATATIISCEDGSSYSTTAYAREEESKKGMDGSQVTGASSSYARKYALNGLLCIDDTADSDTTNTGDKQSAPRTQPAPQKKATNTAAKVDRRKVFTADKADDEEVMKWLYRRRKDGIDAKAALLGAFLIDDILLGQVIENFEIYLVNNNLA